MRGIEASGIGPAWASVLMFGSGVVVLLPVMVFRLRQLHSGGMDLFWAGVLSGLAFALYPLCVAHTNDHVGSGDRVGASGGLVLLYSLGAVAGPLVASSVMALAGPTGLFWSIGGAALAATAFGLWRLYAGDALPGELQSAFRSVPRTTAVALQNEDTAGPG